MQQSSQTLYDRVKQIIGNPILVPASLSYGDSHSEDHGILPFDPHAMLDEDPSQTPASILKREIATHATETITKGLLALFKEDAQALPKCKPFLRSFVSTRIAGVVMAAELPCGSWGCKECGPKLKLKWYLSQVGYLADVDYLEKIYIDKADWQAVHRMINRQGERYLKYEQDDETILLITTAQLGGTEIPYHERETELVIGLYNTAFVRQPISQSRNWDTGSTREQAESDPNWEPLDSLRFQDLDSLMDALQEMGIHSSSYSIYSRTFGSMRATMFKAPEGKFWPTIWKLGAMTRRYPNGIKESRETEWEWPE